MLEEILNAFILIPFKRNTVIGELKLQSCEEANIFYATQVQTDENLAAGDYSQAGLWKANPFTHQNKAEEDVVVVDGDSTIVQGIFKDQIGEMNQAEVEYMVNVYVWVETGDSSEKTGGDK